MLWVVLDGVEEKLHVQSRQRSLYCVCICIYMQPVSYLLCDYILYYSKQALGHDLI